MLFCTDKNKLLKNIKSFKLRLETSKILTEILYQSIMIDI